MIKVLIVKNVFNQACKCISIKYCTLNDDDDNTTTTTNNNNGSFLYTAIPHKT